MNKPIPLLGMLLVLWIGGGTWLYHNSACCSAVAGEAYSSPFLIKDGGASIASHPQNFVFGYGSHSPIIPDQVEASFSKVATYLKEHPDKSLMLTGHYRFEEVNSTNFGSLGLARADTIKKYLVSLGLPAEQIKLSDQLDDDLVKREDQMHGALNYTILTEEKKIEAKPLEVLTAKPLTVYFDNRKQDLILNEDQKAYFEYLIKYLAENPEAMVEVTGHTDSDGILSQNRRLGRKRAEFVKEYMKGLGIKSKQINTSSKGPDEPIATNETEEGQAKNRRVEISIK